MAVVKLIYDVDGWAHHRNSIDIVHHSPDDFEFRLGAACDTADLSEALGDEEPDVVMLLPYWLATQTRAMIRNRGWKSSLVVYWNHGWPGKYPVFRRAYEVADLVIFNHMEYWSRTGPLQRTAMIPMGVNLDLFRVTVPVKERKLKILWVGSMLNSAVKGYRKCIMPLGDMLAVRGIEYDFRLTDSFGVNRFSADEMVDWYNSGTVLVVASVQEGTPNVALEAAACGCTVVSTRVGNMPELIRNGVNGCLVDGTPEAILEGIEFTTANYERMSTQMLQDIQAWGWRDQCKSICATLRELLQNGGGKSVRQSVPRPDFSGEITVFVTTVGAKTYGTCLQHLEEQDCEFRLETIDNVAPMSAAFNQMLDRCETPYYVQVDEDMLLYPYAIRLLHNAITSSPRDVALWVGELFDVHLGRWIEGLKIFKHEIVNGYRHDNVVGSEEKQLSDMRKDGYRHVCGRGDQDAPSVLFGLHVVSETPVMYFERYATLAYRRKTGIGDLRWLDEYAGVFRERAIYQDSELDLFALLGYVAGNQGRLLYRGGEKDYRQYGTLIDGGTVSALLEEIDLSPELIERVKAQIYA